MLIQIDQSGRVTIPHQMRKYLGLEPGEEVKIEIKDKQIIITKVEKSE